MKFNHALTQFSVAGANPWPPGDVEAEIRRLVESTWAVRTCLLDVKYQDPAAWRLDSMVTACAVFP